MYNFLEPLLYGSSNRNLPLASPRRAACVLTWLGGPAGLLLATPLTVCVATLGRYVPDLAFLRVLLTDEPILPPPTRFYQRLLAMDLKRTPGSPRNSSRKIAPKNFMTVIIPL